MNPSSGREPMAKKFDYLSVCGPFHEAQDVKDKVDNGYYAMLLIRTPLFEWYLV